ncbi:hypothetical protein C8R44DRAFT_739506 [Mycena epipterygia]|nr:hypothetical protein C8R44DRAFT_739506 [Mycena epipterygia]
MSMKFAILIGPIAAIAAKMNAKYNRLHWVESGGGCSQTGGTDKREGEVDCVLEGRGLDWCKGGRKKKHGCRGGQEAEEGREMATCSPRPRNALAKIDYAAEREDILRRRLYPAFDAWLGAATREGRSAGDKTGVCVCVPARGETTAREGDETSEGQVILAFHPLWLQHKAVNGVFAGVNEVFWLVVDMVVDEVNRTYEAQVQRDSQSSKVVSEYGCADIVRRVDSGKRAMLSMQKAGGEVLCLHRVPGKMRTPPHCLVTLWPLTASTLSRRTPSTPTPLRTRQWAQNHPSVTTAPTPSSPGEARSVSPSSPRSLSLPSDSFPQSVLLSNSTSDSDSDIDSDFFDSSIMTPPTNKPVLATITHLKPDRCPILEAGVITPEILYLWRRACQKYLKNCKERTADDLVSFVADEMREPILEKWYMASQTRIDALKLDAYISELGALVLEKGWEGKMRRKVLGAKMAMGQKFADWAYDIQNVNAILSQAAPAFALSDTDLKNILDAGLTETLQADLDTEPVLSTELNAWISEVKGRDDRLKFETGRMQEIIDAQPAKSSPKGKLSLAERLSSPKPSLASRFTTPPPKKTTANCPPLTDAEKILLDLHDGCRRCRKFYIGHRTQNCDGEFPDAATYHTLTQADAEAQAAVRGKTLQVKREPTAAVRTSKNILDADYEESDSDRDGYILPPLTVPHLYANVTLSGPSVSEFPVPVFSLLDIGCPSVVISDQLVKQLGLRRFPLPTEEDNLSSLSESPLSCREYVKLKVSSADGNWTSRVVRAKVNVGLFDKRTGFDLLNNPTHPPRQWTPEWTVPAPTPKKPKRKPVSSEPVPLGSSALLPISVMLQVKNRIDDLDLQKLLKDEDIRLKNKHADVFPLRLPDNTADLPGDILHTVFD